MRIPSLGNVEAMLFDFEGTLVDFQWRLSEAVEETLKMLSEMGLPKESIQSRKYSTLMPEAMQMAAEIGLPPGRVRERIGLVYDRYDEDALTRWSLRPQVKDFLSALRAKGISTALVSNVGGKTLSKATSKLGIEGYFDFLVSRNDVVNPKPSPEGIHMALERMGEKRGNSVFLGDSLDDVHAARNAGLRVIIIAEGENQRSEILAAKPDHIVQGYEELLRDMFGVGG